MERNNVKVIPSINRQNQLQGFRFEYKGTNLKGSEVHRSMSMGRIARRMNFEKKMAQRDCQGQEHAAFGKDSKCPDKSDPNHDKENHQAGHQVG